MTIDQQGLGEPNNPGTPSASSGAVEVPGVGQVTVDELVKGYLRQQDYTQKTQSVAQEREKYGVAADLLNSLERDPDETLRALAEAYEVNLGSTSTPAGNTEQTITTPAEDDLPAYVKQELEENRKFREASQDRQLKEEIEREIQTCKSTYGDFDEAAVVQFALARGIPDIEVAYLAWDRQQSFEKGKQAGLQDANARVAGTVEGGTSTAPATKPVDSYEEAITNALNSLPSPLT